MEKSCPSVCPSFFFLLLWGMGLHGNSEVSDVCLVWSRGPRVLVHISTSVLWRENGGAFVWMRCQDNCNWSALLKNFVRVLQCTLVQSVCVCICVRMCVHVSVCVCECVCVCVGVLFVSLVFSQRRFTEYHLPPLATLPTTSLHHTTLVLICIRFTCPRCYSEGQEDRLVVPHADIGPDVIIDYRLLFIFRL